MALLGMLVALVEERSVTRAAERLGLSQSGVSHALARLREQLDDPLLVRTTHGLQPTPRAFAVVERVGQIHEHLEAIVGGSRSFEPQTARRTFTIAADDNMSLCIVLPLLARLRREAPGIDLQVAPVPHHPQQALEQGDVDLIINMRESDQPTLRTRLLFGDSFVSAVRPGHAALDAPLSPAEFAAAEHVVVSTRLPRRSFVDDALARHGLSRRVVLRVHSFIVAAHAAASSDLVLTMPRGLIQAVAARLQLCTFVPPVELPTVQIYQTWHARLHDEPGHVWLRRQIEALVDATSNEQ